IGWVTKRRGYFIKRARSPIGHTRTEVVVRDWRLFTVVALLSPSGAPSAFLGHMDPASRIRAFIKAVMTPRWAMEHRWCPYRQQYLLRSQCHHLVLAPPARPDTSRYAAWRRRSLHCPLLYLSHHHYHSWSRYLDEGARDSSRRLAQARLR